MKVENDGGGGKRTQTTTRKKGITNMKRNKHFNYSNKMRPRQRRQTLTDKEFDAETMVKGRQRRNQPTHEYAATGI